MNNLHNEMILINEELNKIIYSNTKSSVLFNKLLNYKIKKIQKIKKLKEENHIKSYLIEIVENKIKELQDYY